MENNEIINNKNEALTNLENYLNKCILSDKKHQKKANLISYWIKDYVNYLSQEESFNSSNLKHYSRGDVIKANLGFNVGNEEGGLHYCVVLDKINAKSYSTLTVIPLTSQKPGKKIRDNSVYLGVDIYYNLLLKCKKLMDENGKKACEVQEKLLGYFNDNIYYKPTPEDFKVVQLSNLSHKILKEIEQMKTGTIALVNQITTISKQRIYDPKKDLDILSGIKISNANLDLIDEKIKKLFIK